MGCGCKGKSKSGTSKVSQPKWRKKAAERKKAREAKKREERGFDA